MWGKVVGNSCGGSVKSQKDKTNAHNAKSEFEQWMEARVEHAAKC